MIVRPSARQRGARPSEAERGGVETQVEHRVHDGPEHLFALEACDGATGPGDGRQQVRPVLGLRPRDLEGLVGKVQRGQRLAQAPGHPRHRLTHEHTHRQREERRAQRLRAAVGDEQRHQVGGARERQELQ